MENEIVYTPEEAMKIRKVLINIGHLDTCPKIDDCKYPDQDSVICIEGDHPACPEYQRRIRRLPSLLHAQRPRASPQTKARLDYPREAPNTCAQTKHSRALEISRRTLHFQKQFTNNIFHVFKLFLPTSRISFCIHKCESNSIN